jgi:hypothetical protein
MFNVKVLGVCAAMTAIVSIAKPGQSAIGNSVAADQKLSAVTATTGIQDDSRNKTTTTTTRTTTNRTTTTTYSLPEPSGE